MLTISAEDIQHMESRKRAAFINSISGFKNASLLGSIDGNGHTNLALFSSVTHIGSHPPLLGVIFRPDTVSRHTLENILETGCFTINHVTQRMFRKAHQTAARYPKEQSEFDAVGLTPIYSTALKAPYVAESRLRMGLLFKEKHELKINGTILVIGQVIEVDIPEDSRNHSGGIDLAKAGSISLSGLDTYYTAERLSRLSYPKPDQEPADLED